MAERGLRTYIENHFLFFLFVFDLGFFGLWGRRFIRLDSCSSSLSMSCPFVVKGHISEIGCTVPTPAHIASSGEWILKEGWVCQKVGGGE